MGKYICKNSIRCRKQKHNLANFHLGDELNFLLTMKSYRPPIIRCTDTPPAARPESTSCQAILDTMNASSAQTIFGAVGVPEVEEYLPQVLTEREDHDSISIWAHSLIAVSSYSYGYMLHHCRHDCAGS